MSRFHSSALTCALAFVLCGMCGPAAAQQYKTGLLFLDEKAYRSIPLASKPAPRNLPAEIDLGESFPPPGDQGNQGSCVGWAVAYALKSHQERLERNWSLASRDHLFSPAYIYNQIRLTEDCNGGTYFATAFGLLQREGVVPLSDFEYNASTCSTIPGATLKQSARQFAIAGWWRVDLGDPSILKLMLNLGMPVLIGITVDQNFQNLQAGQIYDTQGGEVAGGHAVVIIGYSDSRQAYKILNSWGKQWGDGGYGWIEYATFKRIVNEAYIVRDVVTSPATASSAYDASDYDPGRDNAEAPDESMGEGDMPASAANRGENSESEPGSDEGFIDPEK